MLILRKIIISCALVIPQIQAITLETVASALLTHVIDYDSRAYLALAREKEAKRRARFEAMRMRLMEEDVEVALAGSKLTLSIARTVAHFFMLLFDPRSLMASIINLKDNGIIGAFGFAFLIGWATNKVFHLMQKKLGKFLPQKPTKMAPSIRYLSENCQIKPRRYTSLHKRIIRHYLKSKQEPVHGSHQFSRNP